MNDSLEDLYQCIGYCLVDDAGYCLGCGRPTGPVAAPRTSEAGNMGGTIYADMRDEIPSVDGGAANKRFPVDSSAQ